MQRDERALWTKFRAACDAVFDARQSKRKEEDVRKNEHRHALQELCAQLEQLARDTARRIRKYAGNCANCRSSGNRRRTSAPDLRDLEARFSKGKAALEAMLSARVRSREAAYGRPWRRKNVCARNWTPCCARWHFGASGDGAVATQSATVANAGRLCLRCRLLEKKMLARRDAALAALADADAAGKYLARMEQGAAARRKACSNSSCCWYGQPARDSAAAAGAAGEKTEGTLQQRAGSNSVSAGERCSRGASRRRGRCARSAAQRKDSRASRADALRQGAPDEAACRVLDSHISACSVLGARGLRAGATARRYSDSWQGSPNFDERRPNFVVIHHTSDDSVDEAMRTLANPLRKVSAHYLIGATADHSAGRRTRARLARRRVAMGRGYGHQLGFLESNSTTTGANRFRKRRFQPCCASWPTSVSAITSRQRISSDTPMSRQGARPILARTSVEDARGSGFRPVVRSAFAQPPPAFDAMMALRALGYDSGKPEAQSGLSTCISADEASRR